MKKTNMNKLYAKYGGEDHIQIPNEIKLATVEKEVFPDQHAMKNSIITTEESGLVGTKTKYNEDVLIGTHTTVWGSTFDIVEKRWGFKCCLCYDKSVLRCLGEAGRKKVIKEREEKEEN